MHNSGTPNNILRQPIPEFEIHDSRAWCSRPSMLCHGVDNRMTAIKKFIVYIIQLMSIYTKW